MASLANSFSLSSRYLSRSDTTARFTKAVSPGVCRKVVSSNSYMDQSEMSIES